MVEGTIVRMQCCLDRIRKGDETARAELINAAGKRLARLAARMFNAEGRLRRWEDTGDVLQNGMVRLLRRLKNVTPATPREFFRLAAGEIRRELIALVRHYFGPCGPGTKHDTNAGRSACGEAEADLGHLPDAEPGPSNLAQWAEFHEGIDQLPEDQREVFDLIWYQGLSYVEAARVLGVATRTITRRWQAACLALQDRLGERLPPF